MKILYAEAWMVHALAAASLPRSALLDVPQLLNTLSVEDVAIYLALNKKLADFLPAPVVGSAAGPVFDLTKAPELALKDALFNVKLTGKDMPADAKETAKVLTCDLISADTILLRYIDAPADSTDPVSREAAFYDRFLRQLYTVLPFEQLSVLPAMNAYLSLRKQLLTPNRIV